MKVLWHEEMMFWVQVAEIQRLIVAKPILDLPGETTGWGIIAECKNGKSYFMSLQRETKEEAVQLLREVSASIGIDVPDDQSADSQEGDDN